MARFAIVEQPPATLALTPQMVLLREVASRLQAQVKQTTQATNRLHNLMARVFPELATLADDIAAGWVLHLLDKYLSPERIAQARLASIQKIPYLPADQAEPLHQAAQQSVGSLRGVVAETLVRDLVAQLRHCEQAEQNMRDLLTAAHDDLPASGHLQVITIPGIGAATAAVLTAKIVDIDRFETPEHLVGYFGVFPTENTSGVDKQGRPLPAGTLRMSQKGNDLARGYLWNAARAAITFNPAVRALYQRLRAKGKRGDVAIGHCMRKLRHLVFAVWKTNRPFDEHHYPWESPSDTPVSTPLPAQPATVMPPAGNEKAAGHTREVPAKQVVTTANPSVAPAPVPVNPTPAPTAAARPRIDYAFLRRQVTLEQVLRHLSLLDQLHGSGQQRRGPCPIHGHATDRQHTFSVHLGKNVFQCFKADCAVQGNVLDFWAALHRLPLYDAALNLAAIFHLPRNREEEPVK
jgi:transposase